MHARRPNSPSWSAALTAPATMRCADAARPTLYLRLAQQPYAVMGGAQPAKVLRIVTEAKQLKNGLVPDPRCWICWSKSLRRSKVNPPLLMAARTVG